MTADMFTVKKVRAITQIKKLLEDPNLVEFKIGKTDNLEGRESVHKSEGYTQFISLAKLDTLEEMNQLEDELITYLGRNPKCTNKKGGGGGDTSTSNEHYVYVITK